MTVKNSAVSQKLENERIFLCRVEHIQLRDKNKCIERDFIGWGYKDVIFYNMHNHDVSKSRQPPMAIFISHFISSNALLFVIFN